MIYHRRFGCFGRSYLSHRNSQQQFDIDRRSAIIRSFSDHINSDRTSNTTTTTVRVIELAASDYPKYNKKDSTNTNTSNDNNAIEYKSSTKFYPPLYNNDDDDDESTVNPRNMSTNDYWERCPNNNDNTSDDSNSNTVLNYCNYYSNRFHYRNIVKHFLPANYPDSVSSNYSSYAAYCFMGSMAGSASMVLSTQTLLLAVVGGGDAAGVAVDMIPNDDPVTSSTSMLLRLLLQRVNLQHPIRQPPIHPIHPIIRQ